MGGLTWWTGEEAAFDMDIGERTVVWHSTPGHVQSGGYAEALCGKTVRSLSSGMDSAARLSRDGNKVCPECRDRQQAEHRADTGAPR